MRTYSVSITGESPLLMHQDNIEWSERMRKWREDPSNKKFSVKGDDRSPAHTWLGSLYHDLKQITMPADNLMRCLMEGGGGVLVPGGKSGKTFKAQTQSGMVIMDDWQLLIKGKPIDVKPILALEAEKDFERHLSVVQDAGFSLFVKRAKIGTSKHVRVRPRFEMGWSAVGALQVWDEQLTTQVLRDILKIAGSYKGLGDWRPSSRTPGPFGRFKAEIEEVK